MFLAEYAASDWLRMVIYAASDWLRMVYYLLITQISSNRGQSI